MFKSKAYTDFVFWLTVKPRLRRLKKLLPEAEIYPCGSRVVCSPPVLTTDIDFLVYSEVEVAFRLVDAGYTQSIYNNYHLPNGNEYSVWRKGVVNLVVTMDKGFTENHQVATHICKSYNVRRKWHRIIVYEALRGNINTDTTFPDDFSPEIKNLLVQFTGPYGAALIKAYRVQKGLI